MLSVVITSSIWTSLQYLHLDVIRTLPLYAITGAIINSTAAVGVYLMVLFVQYLNRPKLKTSHLLPLILISIIAGCNSVFMVGGILDSTYVMEIASLTVQFINPVLLIVVVTLVQVEFNQIFAMDLGPKQRMQIRLFQLGVLLILLGMIPVLIVASIYGEIYLSYGFILMTMSLILIITGYLINDKIAFVLPERTYLVTVVTADGIEKFSKIFEGGEHKLFTEKMELVTGALHAVVNIIDEFNRGEIEPSLIEFQNQCIIYSWTTEFFVATFSEYDSTIIREATNELVRRIEGKYGRYLSEKLNKHSHLKIDDLVDEVFSFVYYE